MQDELIIPNLHVVLVHYPIALLCLGTMIEFFAFLWRASSFRTAGRWMLMIGAVSAIPATFSGLYALNDVVKHHSTEQYGPWHVVAGASTITEAQWADLTRHLVLQSGAALLSVIVVVTWVACSNRWRRLLHLPMLALLLVSCAATGAGSWLGGEIVYRHALANVAAGDGAAGADRPVVAPELHHPIRGGEPVVPEKPPTTLVAPPIPAPVQPVPEAAHTPGPPPVKVPFPSSPPVATPAPPPATVPEPQTRPATSVPSTQASARPFVDLFASASASRQSTFAGDSASGPAILQQAARVAPPLQLHIVLAGFAVAFAAVSLGLAIRQITGQVVFVIEKPADIGAAFEPHADDPFEKPPVIDPDAATIPPTPAARFWLIAGLLGIMTSLAGWWFLAVDSSQWKPIELWNLIYPPPDGNKRRLAHVVTGGVIILVPFVLAIAARFSPKRKVLLTILALMLFLAIAAQIWLGSLLLFDSIIGPTLGWNG